VLKIKLKKIVEEVEDKFKKEREECPGFGQHSINVFDCQMCKEEDPALYKKCMGFTKEEEMKVKVTKGAEVPDTKAVKGKAPAAKKATGEISKFGGHRPGSQGFIIDGALAKGGTIETIIKNSGVESSRVRGHIQFLKAKRGVVFTESKTGVITATKK